MLKTKKNIYWLIWTVVLAMTVYFAVVYFKVSNTYVILFILCAVSGIAFDFMVCDWKYFSDSDDKPKSGENKLVNFFIATAYKFEHYDINWKNLSLFLLLLLHGLIVFIIIGFIAVFFLKEKINWWNILAISGIIIPYFFHRSYYYFVRIPEPISGVYIYTAKKEYIEKLISEVNKLNEKRKNGIDTSTLVLLNKKALYSEKIFNIPAIPRTWNYKQLFDFIFYQNNQNEHPSHYKENWDPIPLFKDNDRLIRTCWEIRMEKGTYEKNDHSDDKIADFSKTEFTDKTMEDNLFFKITRVI